MKKQTLLRWILVPIIVFGYMACENEPLEGEFVVEDGTPGKLTAKVNGQSFESDAATAAFNNGILIISGSRSNGNTITINFNAVGECTYDLSSAQSFGGYFENDAQNIFVSLGSEGGMGTATITSINLNAQQISGTFSFMGVREVDDGNGGTTTETVEITEGVFEAIPIETQNNDIEVLSCEEIDGGGEDPVMNDAEASFFALVDGAEFMDTNFESELVVDDTVVKLTAADSLGAQIQFFIPRNLGIGTYAMQPIFDGTVLVGSYNPGNGGEPLTSSPGTITFIEFGETTGKLKATFSFTATDPLGSDPSVAEITEGAFNIDYLPDSGTVENTFMATIDGEEYLPTSITIDTEPVADQTVVHLTTINEDINQSVSFSFPIDIEAGDYPMDPFVVTGNEKVGIYNPDIGNSILFKSDETGTLTIITHQFSNGVIEANFAYTAKDPVGNYPEEFTINGSFIITIQ